MNMNWNLAAAAEMLHVLAFFKTFFHSKPFNHFLPLAPVFVSIGCTIVICIFFLIIYLIIIVAIAYDQQQIIWMIISTSPCCSCLKIRDMFWILIVGVTGIYFIIKTLFIWIMFGFLFGTICDQVFLAPTLSTAAFSTITYTPFGLLAHCNAGFGCTRSILQKATLA